MSRDKIEQKGAEGSLAHSNSSTTGKRQWHLGLISALLLLLLVITAFISLMVGVADITLADLFDLQGEKWDLVLISRIPRTVALILAGIGMSITGVIMQQITQNKFVSPTTAGTLEAAKLGLLLFMIIVPLGSSTLKMLFAFIFTFLANIIFLAIVRRIRHRNIVFVPLVGLMFGGIIGAISSFIAIQLNILQDVNSWMIGDFSGILQGRYELIYLTLPAIVITYLYANKFTIAGMGEDFAKGLGLNYNAVLHIGLFCVSFTVSAVVITAGSIPFLGLIVPNMVSLIFGDHLKRTLPLVALFGAIFLLLCDIIGRLLLYPFEVPIGLTVSIIGAAIFLIMILRRR